jgi:glycosyltransferase involved in cell wall biosynthesis
MSNIKVGIILACYKPENYIFNTIDSILNQSYTNWNLYIVDDHTPDNSFNKVIDYCNNLKEKIIIIQLKRNARASGARMMAIEKTKVDLVAFIDQDDIWQKEKLEKQVAIFEKRSGVIAVHTNVEHIDNKSEKLVGRADKENNYRNNISSKNLNNREMAIELFKKNFIRFASSVVRRDKFLESGGFNVKLNGGEDEEFWVRFANYGDIYHLREKLTHRRIHENNVSSKYRLPRKFGELKAIDLNIKSYKYLKPFYYQRKNDILISAIKRSKKLKKIGYYYYFRIIKLFNNLSKKVYKKSLKQ